MGRTLRMAVVGAGRMGGLHARVCAENPAVDLVAVVDQDGNRAAEVAGRHKAGAGTAVEPYMSQIDAAVVAVPTAAHVAVAAPLLTRGISCLVEKPLAGSAAAAAELVAAPEGSGAVLQVGHTERFNPAFMALGRYDLKPRFIETERISPCRFRSMDVGVVMDMMIHDIDLVLSLVRSPVTSVDAVGVNVIAATEDMANVRVRFANGCVADLTASRAALKVERRIRIFSQSAYVGMDFNAKKGIVIRPGERLTALRESALRTGRFDASQVGDTDYEELLETEEIAIDDHDALAVQLKAFVGAVREESPVVVTGEDGLRAVELAEQIVEAIKAQPVGG